MTSKKYWDRNPFQKTSNIALAKNRLPALSRQSLDKRNEIYHNPFLRAQARSVCQEVNGSRSSKPGRKKEARYSVGNGSGGHRRKLGELAVEAGRWQLAGCFVLDMPRWEQAVIVMGEGRLGMRIGNTKCPDSHITGVKPEVSIQSPNKPKPVVCPKLEQDPRAHVRAQTEHIGFYGAPGFCLWSWLGESSRCIESWQAVSDRFGDL